MSEGITPNQLTNPLLEGYFSVVVELNNAQILALPTAPFVLITETETLDYVGFPSSIPVLVQASVVLNNIAGAYVGDPGAALVIGMGTDWSTDLTQRSIPNGLTNAGLQVIPLCPRMQTSVSGDPETVDMFAVNTNLNGQVKDNAIVLAASNSGVDFTGGHASNKMWVILAYQLLDVS